MVEDVRVPAAQIPRKGRSIVVNVPLSGTADGAVTGASAGVVPTQEVVVFNTGEGFYAIANRCPHKGWPLAGGNRHFLGSQGWRLTISDKEIRFQQQLVNEATYARTLVKQMLLDHNLERVSKS